MTQMAEFIARENVRSFKAQIATAPDGPRKVMLRELLAKEEQLLRDLMIMGSNEPQEHLRDSTYSARPPVGS